MSLKAASPLVSLDYPVKKIFECHTDIYRRNMEMKGEIQLFYLENDVVTFKLFDSP